MKVKLLNLIQTPVQFFKIFIFFFKNQVQIRLLLKQKNVRKRKCPTMPISSFFQDSRLLSSKLSKLISALNFKITFQLTIRAFREANKFYRALDSSKTVYILNHMISTVLSNSRRIADHMVSIKRPYTFRRKVSVLGQYGSTPWVSM